MNRAQPDEIPKRRNWVSAAGPEAAAAGHAAFARAGFTDPVLVLRWDEIAGAETARLARPLRFSQGPHGGVLTLKAEPGAAVFLQHETRALCERINTFVGRPLVSRIKFVQGPLAPKPSLPARRSPPGPLTGADPVHAYCGPERLRDALQKLAAARKARTTA
jgi:hypothetical protein